MAASPGAAAAALPDDPAPTTPQPAGASPMAGSPVSPADAEANGVAAEPAAAGWPQQVPNFPMQPHQDNSAWTSNRGLDAGLSSMCPRSFGNKESEYKEFRRRARLYQRACEKRGTTAVSEGAMLLVSKFDGKTWDALEQIDEDSFDAPDIFDRIWRVLDFMYKYDGDVEQPQLFEKLNEFGRLKGETLSNYKVRAEKLVRELKITGCELPPSLVGHIFLSRSGVPRWQIPTVRAHVGACADLDSIYARLKLMFGAESVASNKELANMSRAPLRKAEAYLADEDWEADEDDAYYEEEDEAEEDAYYEAEDGEDDYPEDLAQAEADYDDALISYQEARQRMRDVANSRGFYPIVALGPDAASSTPAASAAPSSTGAVPSHLKSRIFRHSNVEKGKGRGKGKGKSKGRPGPKGGGKSDATRVAARAAATRTPGGSFGNGGGAAAPAHRFKRSRPSEEAGVALCCPEEVLYGEECFFVDAGSGIGDSGSTQPVMGKDTWKLWMVLLENKGYLEQVSYERASRRFKFGGGEVKTATASVSFPVSLFGTLKHLKVFLIDGALPLLIARPCFEEWGVVCDFRAKAVLLKDDDPETWHKVRQNDKGHLILDLITGLPALKEAPAEVNAAQDQNDEEAASTELEESSDGEDSVSTGVDTNGENDDPITADLEPDLEHESFMSLLVSPSNVEGERELAADQRHLIEQSLASTSVRRTDRKKVFWEIFVDEGRVSQCLSAPEFADKVSVEIFTLQTGYDFTKRAHRRHVLRRRREEKPDEILMAPPCTAFSQIQSINVHKKAYRKKLDARRKADERNFLRFCRELYEGQYYDGLHAHIEHPARAVSWGTRAWTGMPGYDVYLDQCRYGLHAVGKDRRGERRHGAVRKQTRIRTTKLQLASEVGRKCCCSQPHVALEGGSFSKKSQNYPWQLAYQLAKSVAAPEHLVNEETASEAEPDQLPVEDDAGLEDYKSLLSGLRRKFSASVVAKVVKLHEQFGHPSADVLARELQKANADSILVECAKEFLCEACLARRRPRAVRVVAATRAKHFNDIVDIDTRVLKFRGKKRRVFSILDEYTRYCWDARVRNDKASSEIKILEGWIAIFGAPRAIRCDQSGGHMSFAFRNWCEKHGVKLEMIPKDAHHQLGFLEREHQVRREQVALRWTCAARNRYHSVRGFSPQQWVLGTDPRVGDVLEDPFNLAEQTAAAYDDPAESFVKNIQRRKDAAKSFVEANSARKVRRALLARSRPARQAYEVGQWCFYWRHDKDKEETDLDKVHWHGPALVVACEPSADPEADESTKVYWVCHGTSLMRVIPEHLRPELPEERRAREQSDNTDDASTLDRVRRLLRRVRGPVRFQDLTEQDGPPAEEDRFDEKSDTDSPDGAQPQQAAASAPAADEDRDEAPDYGGGVGPFMPPPSPAPDVPMGEGGREEQADLPHAGVPIVLGPTMQGEAATGEPSAGTSSSASASAAVSAHKRARGDEQQAPQEGQPAAARPRVSTDGTNAARRYDGSPPLPRAPISLDELNAARCADGLPPLAQLPQSPTLVLPSVDAAAVSVPNPEEGLTMLEVLHNEEEVLYVTNVKKKPTVAYSRMDKNEKEAFNDAMRKTLDMWNNNGAWQAVPRSTAARDKLVPLRFLLKYKNMPDGSSEANARVLFQGFKVAEVTDRAVDKDASTLSRLGRNTILLTASVKKWLLFNGDIKNAFHQADDLETAGIELYGEPDSFMREYLGLGPNDVLKMIKPPFGDVRSPKLWQKKAFQLMVDAGFTQHPLDPCLWLSFDDNGKLNGIIGLHVDDVLGCGCSEGPFRQKFEEIRAALRWGHWKEGGPMTFCGVLIMQDPETFEVSCSQADYLKAAKPISYARKERASTDAASPKEVSQYRGLIGTMQWPAAQTMPHAAASISYLQAKSSKATPADLAEANKTLRFMKETSDIPLRFTGAADFSEVRIGAYTDASWALRPDGSSQGGFYVFVMDDVGLGGAARPLVCLDWGSKKLPRVCRSSLSAEAQAAALAVDRMEWCKCFLAAAWFNHDPKSEQAPAILGPSVLVTDSRGLYDASRKMGAVTERRTTIEIMIINERMAMCDCAWRWTSADQQLADGLTKTRSRHEMAEQLRRGYHMLVYDPEAKAAKKKTDDDRKREEKQLGQAIKEYEATKAQRNIRKHHRAAQAAQRMAAVLAMTEITGADAA